MIAYRTFWWNRKEECRPLHVNVDLQRKGRYDIPDRSAVLYVSLQKESAIAEQLQVFRNREKALKASTIFEPNPDLCLMMAQLEIERSKLIDLTNPRKLAGMKLTPADIATHHRERTQKVSEMIYDDKYDGFLWWSTLEAQWTNGTLFAARVKNKIKVTNKAPLSVHLPEVREVMQFLKINII
jgi:hypothetical protein